jgi:hypothetical protein
MTQIRDSPTGRSRSSIVTTTISAKWPRGIIYAYVKDCTVFSGFNKNLSGRKSKFRGMKDELPYAQALLDINELYARRLAALKPSEFPSASGATCPEVQRQLENRIEALCQVQLAEAQKKPKHWQRQRTTGRRKKEFVSLRLQ